MARGKPGTGRGEDVPPEIRAIRERIANAEKKQRVIGREQVAISVDGLTIVAIMVEQGFGNKASIMSAALETGLRRMAQENDLSYGGDVQTQSAADDIAQRQLSMVEPSLEHLDRDETATNGEASGTFAIKMIDPAST